MRQSQTKPVLRRFVTAVFRIRIIIPSPIYKVLMEIIRAFKYHKKIISSFLNRICRNLQRQILMLLNEICQSKCLGLIANPSFIIGQQVDTHTIKLYACKFFVRGHQALLVRNFLKSQVFSKWYKIIIHKLICDALIWIIYFPYQSCFNVLSNICA